MLSDTCSCESIQYNLPVEGRLITWRDWLGDKWKRISQRSVGHPIQLLLVIILILFPNKVIGQLAYDSETSKLGPHIQLINERRSNVLQVEMGKDPLDATLSRDAGMINKRMADNGFGKPSEITPISKKQKVKSIPMEDWTQTIQDMRQEPKEKQEQSAQDELPGGEDVSLTAVPKGVRQPSADQQKLIEEFGWPDAFTLSFDPGPKTPVHTIPFETWTYYEYLTRFEFMDGKLVKGGTSEAVPDNTISARRYRPIQFRHGMNLEEVKNILPVMEFARVDLPGVYGENLTVFTGEQIILGFEKGRLQYVETTSLVPQEGVQP